MATIDVNKVGKQLNEGLFRLDRFVPDADYVDAKSGRQIGSIGRNFFTNQIYAATDARFFGDNNYDCLYLR